MRKLHIVCLLVTLFVFSSGVALAGSIKDRMKSRKPEIATLQAQGVVGYNNKGFFEALSGSLPAVCVAQNKDLEKVYAAIGKKQGVAPSFVSERRAAQVREKAPAGTMLQGVDGQWYKK